MKDESKKKRIIPGDNSKKKVKKVSPKHIEEQESLFARAKQSSPANKKVNETEIVQLKGGGEINVAEYVAETYAGKKTHYQKSFYNIIADLLGQSHDVMKPFRKQRIVALLKRKFIWGRFPNAVQTKIYSKNKYTGYCTRDYWNYQLLTKKADGICFDYIKEFEKTAADVLENSGRLKEFIIEHSIKCGLPIQLDAFDISENK